MLQLVRSLCPRPGQARILDVGCGDALLFDKLAPLGEVEGVEVSADLVSDDNPWRGQITIGPFDTAYQPERQFDLILMLDVLEHFDDPVAALRHAHSLLAPDGHLIVHVPAFPQLWTSHDDFNHHYIRYTRQTLRAVLQHAYFDAASMHYTFHWTYGAKRIVRWKEQFLRHSPNRPPFLPRGSTVAATGSAAWSSLSFAHANRNSAARCWPSQHQCRWRRIVARTSWLGPGSLDLTQVLISALRSPHCANPHSQS